MLKELQLLGLPKNEALVYEALIKGGPSKAGVLIARLDTHRNIIYGALQNLILKGYVTKVSVRGVWEFQITNPDILLSNLRRHEEIARTVIEEIASYKKQSERQMVVYEGEESYARYWLSSIEHAPEGSIDYIAGGDIEHWSQFLGTHLNEYWELCKQKDIQWRTLYFGVSELEKKLLRQLPIPCEARDWNGTVPEKFQGNFNVIHDTVILHTMSSPPRVIEIRDEAIVPMFRNYFDIMWDQAEVITA